MPLVHPVLCTGIPGAQAAGSVCTLKAQPTPGHAAKRVGPNPTVRVRTPAVPLVLETRPETPWEGC